MLVLIAAAHAGQVFEEPVGLDEVIDRAVAVAIVQLGTPAGTPVEIPVPPAGDRDCGTYAYGLLRVDVVEVLRAPPADRKLVVGEPIAVYYANTGDLVSLTHAACVDGTSKSPIFQSFDGDPTTDGAKRIVFLAWEDPYGWREAVSGAWLDAKKERAIRKKLAERSKEPSAR